MKLKRRHRGVPELQMAAMPDLIFTVLFFFMIVTHMRENTIKVDYRQPEGQELVKVTNNAAVINLYVGKDHHSGEYKVQVGDNIVALDELPQTLRSVRENVPSDQMELLTASLQADRQVPMHYINKVRMALREARILKIRYEGQEGADADNKQQQTKYKKQLRYETILKSSRPHPNGRSCQGRSHRNWHQERFRTSDAIQHG
mgnify:FL=1